MSEDLRTPSGTPVVVGRPLEPASVGEVWATSDLASVLVRPCPVPAARLKALMTRQVPPHRPDGRLVLRWPSAPVLDQRRRLVGVLVPAVDPSRTASLALAANRDGRALHPWLKTWTLRELLATALDLATLAAVLDAVGLDLGNPLERDVQVWPDGAVTLLDALLLPDGRCTALGDGLRTLLAGDADDAVAADLMGPELPQLAGAAPQQWLEALQRAQWHLTPCPRGHAYLADPRGCPFCHYGL